MKVIDQIWFTNLNGTVGIVTIEEDGTGDRKAYIGVVPGEDEKADAEAIIAWGNKFSLNTAQRIERFLQKGVKKLCDNCGHPIEPVRLENLPQANLCLSCKVHEEKKAKDDKGHKRLKQSRASPATE